MTERAQDVLARLRALPPEERRAVLELVDEDEPAGPVLSPERRAVVLGRAHDALEGRVEGIPFETVVADLRAAAGLPASPAT